ncbi:MAG: SDR family oxidoreductase [Alphaproteobacteria bacterium]|nr:SDR family oxidoreductase [Alphaproteobacteria bacterium]
MGLDGKVALVTGATSGSGAAIARAFAASGARVMASGRDAARGRATLASLGAAGAFLGGDVADRAFCDRLVAATVERFGTLDILVNNAGVAFRQPVETTTDEQWNETMAVNVHAVFFLSRAALGVMKAKGSGVVINIASDAGVIGTPKLAAYCASKGAIIQFTRAAALDHAKDGIRVNAICPTNIDTPMIEGEARQLGVDLATYRRESAACVPMGRVGTVDEVADMALFLVSDRSRFVTGAALLLDGGVTAG